MTAWGGSIYNDEEIKIMERRLSQNHPGYGK